ncbi:MAG: glycoside hydrolase, partial [Bacteroidetes bacterium]|nr:glycoside hydrolase [Bacteroidota bacterium]
MINPVNSNQIVIGVNSVLLSGCCSGYYCSSDGGYNWSANYLTSSFGLAYCDPSVICDNSGNFYYFALGSPMSNPSITDRILVWKSSNGGMNWLDFCQLALVAPKENDKEYACVDLSHTSPYENNLYVVWSLYDVYNTPNPNDSSYLTFSRSTNRGISFSSPLRISKKAGAGRDSNNCVTSAIPCTGPEGEIYVTWTRGDSAFLQRSVDGGITWLSNDILITPQIGGWTHGNGMPVSACDISNSPYRGTLYFCFADKRNGSSDIDVFLTKSTNGGITWRNPYKVNTNPSGNYQFSPWICVDPVTGYIWIVFYDNRYRSPLIDVTVARSTDGGNSFVNIKVSSSASTMSNRIGDYIGISAYNNKVRAAWDYNVNGGYFEVWCAMIDTLYNTSLEHTPLQFTADTSARLCNLGVYSQVPLASGNNGARLYFKTGSGSFQYV